MQNWVKKRTIDAFHCYRSKWKEGRPAPVFILSHMRSGSSLLLHLLVNHPKITGWGESNVVYETGRDISRQILRTRWKRRAWRDRSRYWVDQVNHNTYTPPTSLLNDSGVKVLFLLRGPEASVASLLRLSEQFYGGRWTQEDAEAYYAERLAFLAETGAGFRNPDRARLLTYEELTGAPAEMLGAITGFLALESPLTATYRPQPFTGRRGDPGERIFAGLILGEERPEKPEAVAPEIRRCYENTRVVLGSFYWKTDRPKH